jgi:hypothetical protein
VARWEHNFARGMGVPDQSAVLLGLLMLRGPQTAGELRINAERWHRFADISSVEAFLDELRERSEEKAARWSCCCPRAGRASSAGRTCCAARWMWRRWPPARRQAPRQPSWLCKRAEALEAEWQAAAQVRRLCAELGLDAPLSPPGQE